MIKTTAHRSLERIATQVYASDHEACAAVGQRIADLIAQRNAECKATVLGLATGHTPIGVYRELIGHHERGLDFSRVITFNLDEYYPMAPGGLQSYRRWMWENLFEHVNVRQDNVHIPDGTIEPERVVQYCADFERKIAEAGGIDVQLLGIGRTGHVGFNEPGSSIVSRTRRIALDPITRRDAASDFFGESSVPREAITMGIGTILEANEVVLLAFGEQKAPIIQRAVEGEVTDSVPATFLHEHPNALVVLDEAAAANLT
ncbi:MAG: glucosamine-6-phosphate deaminase, partial [Phycisphaerae bacterium]